jgi:hypothetical protein
MIFYLVIIRNVIVEKSLLLEARKLYVRLYNVMFPVLCAAKDETSVEFMRPLLNSWAECSVVISC